MGRRVLILKKSRFLHFFTNTFLSGNITFLKGKNNRFTGRLAPLRLCTCITVNGRNNRISFSNGILNRCRVYIQGSGNTLTIDDDCSIHHAVIWIVGNHNTITLGKRVQIFNADLGAEDTSSIMLMQDGARVGGYVALGLGHNKTILSRIYASEGRTVSIGKESAVSDAVTIRTSDSHSILNGGARINPAKDVIIGNNVWICSGAVLLKGAGVGDGCILGGNSMLTKDYTASKHSLLAGTPAKPIRENVSWNFNVE